MTQVTRREAVRVIAAGAAIAGAGGLAVPAVGSAPAADDLVGGSETRFAAARKSGAFGEPRTHVTALARVAHCRSWDSSVYLHIDSSTHGFVRLSPQGFAIAAAAQVGGRPVVVQCWGHDPIANDGVGRFDGAHVALDARDFPDAGGGTLIG